MKLLLHLGLAEPRRLVSWWSTIEDFPIFCIYKGNKFERLSYQKDPTDRAEYLVYFNEIGKADPIYNGGYVDIDYLFNRDGDSNKCCCGAEFSSFSWDHMRFCDLWKPW